MISFALILMTLPSRMAAARAEQSVRARHSGSSAGLEVSSREYSRGERGIGICVKRQSSKTGGWDKRLYNELRTEGRNNQELESWQP